MKIYEYRIPNIIRYLKINEYRIVLFGPNYSNNRIIELFVATLFGSLAALYLDDIQYTRFLDSRWEYIKQTHKTRVMVFTSNSHKMSHKVLLLEFGFDFTVFPWNSKPSIAAGLNPELQCPCPHTFNIWSFYFCLFRIPLLPHQQRRLIPLSPKYCERHESCSLCFDCPDPGVFLL